MPDTEPKIIAVGDIHGHRKTLDALLEILGESVRMKEYRLVFLGDYVDRGPDVRGTIDRLLEIRSHSPDSVFLMGNHEYALIRACGLGGVPVDVGFRERWPWNYNGVSTLLSYEAEAREELAEKMPKEHQDFLVNLPWFFETERYFFVHAGLWNAPIDEQRFILEKRPMNLKRPSWLYEQSLATISNPFWDKKVVSGHVIQDRVRITPYHILVDTGAYYDNALSAVILPAETPVSVPPVG